MKVQVDQLLTSNQFTTANIQELLTSAIGYTANVGGAGSNTDFNGLIQQVDNALGNLNSRTFNLDNIDALTLRIHKIRLMAADIHHSKQDSYTQQERKAMQKKLEALAMEMNAAKMTLQTDASGPKYIDHQHIIIAALQKEATKFGVTLPGQLSFPNVREARILLNGLANEAENVLSKLLQDQGCQPGKMTTLRAALNNPELQTAFYEMYEINSLDRIYLDEGNPLCTQYNQICEELFNGDNKIQPPKNVLECSKFTTAQQSKLFQLMVLELKIEIQKAKTPESKAAYQNKLKLLETLPELAEPGYHRKIVACQTLATVALAILGAAIPATVAAAADLSAHGALQLAIDEAMKQNNFDIFNEKVLEAIKQAMPEFTSIVAVCGLLGMIGTLTLLFKLDNSVIYEIGGTEALRQGLKDLEVTWAKATVAEHAKT